MTNEQVVGELRILLAKCSPDFYGTRAAALRKAIEVMKGEENERSNSNGTSDE